jgi:predicted nucleic acid-binding protein
VAHILLDSTVLIDCLRRRPAAARVNAIWSAGDVACVTAVNVDEVVVGLRPSELAGARRLFASFDVLPLRLAEGWQAGEWRREFRARGITLSQSDCLIAAAALSAHAAIVTGNPGHFPMEEVTVEHWPVGT